MRRMIQQQTNRNMLRAIVEQGYKGGNTVQKAKERLEYLRGEIEAERISYGEIVELQSLTKYIEPGDVLLLEWAGVPERRNNG